MHRRHDCVFDPARKPDLEHRGHKPGGIVSGLRQIFAPRDYTICRFPACDRESEQAR